MLRQVNTLNQWYQSQSAINLFRHESLLLDDFMSHVNGDFMVQIGGPTDFALSKRCGVQHKFLLNPKLIDLLNNGQGIQAHFSELPLSKDSIDLVLIPHTLEFMDSPQDILAQVHDGLTPQGQLIILGFNALSLWGWRRLWQRCRGYPWQGRFHTINTVKTWLRRLDFHLVATRTFYFHTPYTKRVARGQDNFTEALGQICLPWFGGAYLIIAQKRQVGMHLLPTYEFVHADVPVNGNGVVKPTTRESHIDCST